MAWEALKIALNIKELAHSNGNFRFSWDNQRKRLDCCLTRLDKVYLIVVQDLDNVIKVSNYII
jgi:hypothetical protein